MIKWQNDEWQRLLNGYEGKADIDKRMKKNMDAFVGDVCNSTYLPRYSAKEEDDDYQDRLTRSANNYFNFPQKIIKIYFNAIFRTTEPVRNTENEEIKRFWKNVDGAGMHIQRFVKEQVFILNRVEGACLIVVDKPPRFKPDDQTITKAEQIANNWFPYAYVLSWRSLVNFGLDRWRNLEFIILDDGKDAEGLRKFKIWDKTDWWVQNEEQKILSSGAHNLGVVPVIRSFDGRNPKHDFQQPLSSLDEVVKLSLKIFELMSILDQIVIAHAFPKIAMPESMFKKIQDAGMGVFNVLIYPDRFEGQQAHYVEMPATEMEKIVELIFDKYPHTILEFASIRSKTDKPREESGIAKTVDSKDELDNLIDMAEAMEEAEQRMTELDAAWENLKNPEYTVSYSKNFDVATINEQLEQMIKLFKEDLHSPQFAKEMVKRVARKMLGNVSDKQWAEIEEEIDAGIDPALSLDDIRQLVDVGVLQLQRIAKRYNPELESMSDEQVTAWIEANLNLLRGVDTAATDETV